MALDLIGEPEGYYEPPEYNEPPGGKCAFTQCDLDAVVELNLQLQRLGGPVPVKLCGRHQMEIVRQFMDHGEDAGPVITETCEVVFEVVFEGQRLRVEDGRLIREDPNGREV